MSSLESYIFLLLEKEMSKLGVKNQPVDVDASSEVGQKIAGDVADLVVNTYGPGGFPGAEDAKQVSDRFSNFYVADVDDDPDINAGILYTDWHGSKKASAIATDGKPASKAVIKKMMKHMFNSPGTWIEVSGAPANIMLNKLGLNSLDDEEKVRKSLPDVGEIIWHGEHPKGLGYGNGWYTRKINGIPETKIIVGNPPQS